MATCSESIASSSAAPSVLAAVDSRSTASTWSTASSGAPGSGSSASARRISRSSARTARGKRSCSSRKRTTDGPSIGPAHGPLVHLQALHATAARPSTAPRRGRAAPPPSPLRRPLGADSTAAARTPSTRVVMSARSRARPRRHITYASSWVMAVARTPSSRRLSAITRFRKRSRTRRSRPRSASVETYRYRSLSVRHPSRGIVSRRRAQVLAGRHDAAGDAVRVRPVADEERRHRHLAGVGRAHRLRLGLRLRADPTATATGTATATATASRAWAVWGLAWAGADAHVVDVERALELGVAADDGDERLPRRRDVGRAGRPSARRGPARAVPCPRCARCSAPPSRSGRRPVTAARLGRRPRRRRGRRSRCPCCRRPATS